MLIRLQILFIWLMLKTGQIQIKDENEMYVNVQSTLLYRCTDVQISYLNVQIWCVQQVYPFYRILYHNDRTQSWDCYHAFSSAPKQKDL